MSILLCLTFGGSIPFNTKYRHFQIHFLNSQVEVTSLLREKIQQVTDIPSLAPDLGSVLTMRNMLIMEISRPTSRFSYLVSIFTLVYIFTYYFLSLTNLIMYIQICTLT